MRWKLLLTASLLAGCTMGPDFESPTPQWQQAKFDNHSISATPKAEMVADPVDPAWWTVFNDPQLTALEQRVAAANLDVQAAGLRLAEARAQLGIENSRFYPVVNGNANYTNEAQSQNGVIALIGGSGSPAASSNGLGGTTAGLPSSGPSKLTQPFNLYQLGFDASWEIDLWGRVKRSVESADANVIASAEQGHGVLLTSLAELARDYIQLRGVQADIAVVNRNLETAEQTVKLTQDRFNNGLTTELDVANALAEKATTQALLPGLQQREAQLVNAVSLVLGEQPGALRAELAVAKPVPPVPPRVGVGVPSDLARRRPDIRQAEAQLHAATADVGVAVADFYPRFTLSASAALQALEPHELVDWGSRTYGAGPSLTLPIFEGGRLTHTLELRQVQQKDAALLYQRTVLQALHDVDNALIATDAESGRSALLAQAVAQNNHALALARERYSGGVLDFLSVLDAERRLLSTELQLNDSTTTVSTDLVQLYKALGGGWDAAAG
jgi:NodT family efflux transporter outer membrane factor (OMF) lipoprotein